MQLQECYESFGGNYQDIKARLMSDSFIQSLVIKFLNDKNYEWILQAKEKKDYGEMFRAVHTLKGVCQNLSFTCLSQSTHEMTELLRYWESEGVDEEKCEQLWQKISCDYESVINAITVLKESGESKN